MNGGKKRHGYSSHFMCHFECPAIHHPVSIGVQPVISTTRSTNLKPRRPSPSHSLNQGRAYISPSTSQTHLNHNASLRLSALTASLKLRPATPVPPENPVCEPYRQLELEETTCSSHSSTCELVCGRPSARVSMASLMQSALAWRRNATQ